MSWSWPRRSIPVALALAMLLWPTRAGASQAARYDGPLVDAHAHLEADSGITADTLIALYDAVGVRGAWVFGLPWALATAAWERYPDRVVPFLAEPYANPLGPGSSYADPTALDGLLAGGFVRGLGEVSLRHSAFRLGPSGGDYAAPATSTPADAPALLAAYAVAGRYGAPVTVHQEAAYAAELERAVQATPGTTFVWAHAGHGPAATLRPLLARYPNLYADLSARTPWLGPGTVLTRGDGSVDADWAALLREFPDRFVLGFDLFVAAHFRPSYVRDTVEYYRALLGQLDPTTAESIGYRTAERLAPFSATGPGR